MTKRNMYLLSHFKTSYFSWYFLTLCLLAILIDTFWVSIKRKGQEWCWFSVSNFAYTIVLLTNIIELVYVKVQVGDSECNDTLTFVHSYHQKYSIYVRII
jgi:hypothetical protein